MKSSAQTREHDPLTEEEQDDEHVHELRYRRPFDVLVPRQSHHPSHVMVESPFVFFTDGSVLYSTPNLGRGGSFCTRGFKSPDILPCLFYAKKNLHVGEGRRTAEFGVVGLWERRLAVTSSRSNPLCSM